MTPENPTENTAETPEAQPLAASQTQTAPPASPERPEEEEIVDVNLGCLREVAVEIPANVVSKEFDSVAQRYTKAPVPGFRRGKVPASIARNRFANEIRRDVLESLLPRYFRDAVVKEGFNPISEPQVHSVVMEPGQPIQFKAAFEIMPEIQLGNYQEMKLEVPEIQVTEEDVEVELKRLQEQQSSFDPVDEDRPLQDKDFAQVSFQATVKEANPPQAGEESTEKVQPVEGETAKPSASQPVQVDEILVEIGGSNTIPQFSDNLRGVKAGEERTFDVTYPEDYYDKRMAGKTFIYTVKVNAIKKKTTPELTDKFVQELNQELQTIDDLKKRLHTGILAERQHKVMHEARETLLSQLAANHDFPVPETLIQRQIDFRLEGFLRNLAGQGMRKEDMKRLDFKRLRRTQRETATKEVKAHLLLGRIAEAENLQATEEEVNQEIQVMAEQTKETPEALKQKLEERGAMAGLRSRIQSDKALRFLYDKSVSNARNGSNQE